MRITHDTGDTLVLRGIPGGVGWLVFATFLGVLFSVVFSVVCVHLLRTSGFGFRVVMTALGVALGLLFLVFGVVSLAVGRESLSLDKVNGKGRYHSRSPIIDVPKPFEFSLESIKHVSIERYTERNPGGGGRGGGMSSHDACRARLLISKPRRAVVLDETSNGRDARVRTIADRVAVFLDLPVIESDRREDK
ncbi:MAG: hypothetical protein RBS39_07405 [Phycisphaerales bacterium]|jgi:hypothetical protein|nr:hypothetical protein [Phycisphaerales bacterium]